MCKSRKKKGKLEQIDLQLITKEKTEEKKNSQRIKKRKTEKNANILTTRRYDARTPYCPFS